MVVMKMHATRDRRLKPLHLNTNNGYQQPDITFPVSLRERDVQGAQHIGDVVGNCVCRRTGKEQTNRLLRPALQDERSRIAGIAERLAAQAHDDDLILKSEIARLVLHGYIRGRACDTTDGITGRASEFVDDHVYLGADLALRCADAKDLLRKQRSSQRLGNGAIDLVHHSWTQLDELRERGDLIAGRLAAVEQAGLENWRPDRQLVLVSEDVIVAEDK